MSEQRELIRFEADPRRASLEKQPSMLFEDERGYRDAQHTVRSHHYIAEYNAQAVLTPKNEFTHGVDAHFHGDRARPIVYQQTSTHPLAKPQYGCMYLVKGQGSANQYVHNRSTERLQPFQAVKAKSVSGDMSNNHISHHAPQAGIRHSNPSSKQRPSHTGQER